MPQIYLHLLLNLFILILVCACGGEIETLNVNIRPNKSQFEEIIYPRLMAIRCEDESGLNQSKCVDCHQNGDYQYYFKEGEIDRNYLSAQQKINFDEPALSALLSTISYPTNPITHPVCIPSYQTCSYQWLSAWITWQGEDLNFDDIQCIEDLNQSNR